MSWILVAAFVVWCAFVGYEQFIDDGLGGGIYGELKYRREWMRSHGQK